MQRPGAYSPSGKLYARRALRFAGVDFAPGAELPNVGGKHYELWLSGKAGHESNRRKPIVAAPGEPHAPQRRKRRSR